MLDHILKEHKESILALWVEAIFEAFPPDSSRFLKSVKDPFRNPIGQTFKRSAEILYDCLVAGEQSEQLDEALEQAVRIRAVQDCKASQAVAFVFLLKKCVRTVLVGRGVKYSETELVEFEDRIDGLALEAFDRFMSAKERIFAIQAQETKRRTYKLLERLGDSVGKKRFSPGGPSIDKKDSVRGTG